MNIAVLISGTGSNLKAIIDNINNGFLDVGLKVVIANCDAPGIQYAENAIIINKKGLTHKEHDRKVLEILEPYNIDLVCLAGYTQIIQEEMIERYTIINIHPSLLPSFKGGLHAQRDALNYGVKVTGCTVHFVENDVDTGPIIYQKAVPVYDTDDLKTLSKRILVQEHIIYSKVIYLLSKYKYKIVNRKVMFYE